MLTLEVLGEEHWNEETKKFVYPDRFVLEMEHSLLSLSKWESEFEKPFLSDVKFTPEESLAYFKIMTLTPNVPPVVWENLSQEDIKTIQTYLDRKMTATWFNEVPEGAKSNEQITAELIYYWMIQFQIPKECEQWHLNRLFTLIKVCNFKQEKPKKMSRNEILARNRQLNEQRKAQLGTKG